MSEAEIVPFPNAFEEVDDMIPEGCMPLAFVRAALYLDADGRKTVTADWSPDLESFELYGLMGEVVDFYQMSREIEITEEDEE